jgi:hypothetical protein
MRVVEDGGGILSQARCFREAATFQPAPDVLTGPHQGRARDLGDVSCDLTLAMGSQMKTCAYSGAMRYAVSHGRWYAPEGAQIELGASSTRCVSPG